MYSSAPRHPLLLHWVDFREHTGALNWLLAQCHMSIRASGCPVSQERVVRTQRVSQVQLPGKEVLSQRFAGKRFIEKSSWVPTGQREMLNRSAATTEASPMGSSGAGMAFRAMSNWGKVARPLYPHANLSWDAAASRKTV